MTQRNGGPAMNTEAGKAGESSIDKESCHHPQRDGIGGSEIHVLATPEVAVGGARRWIRRKPALAAAAELGRDGLTDAWLIAQATSRGKLRRSELTIQEVLNIEGDVESARAIPEVRIELRKAGCHEPAIIGSGSVADPVKSPTGACHSGPESVTRRESAGPSLLGR